MTNKAIFYAATACNFIAGTLHLAIVPMFFAQLSIDVMIFFIVSALAKVLCYPVIKKWSNFWIYFGLGGNVILIVPYYSTRKWITCKSIRHSNRTLSNCFHNFLHCYNYERQKKNNTIGREIRLISIT